MLNAYTTIVQDFNTLHIFILHHAATTSLPRALPRSMILKSNDNSYEIPIIRKESKGFGKSYMRDRLDAKS